MRASDGFDVLAGGPAGEVWTGWVVENEQAEDGWVARYDPAKPASPADLTIDGLGEPGGLVFDAGGAAWLADDAGDTVTEYPAGALAGGSVSDKAGTVKVTDLMGASLPAFDGRGNLWLGGSDDDTGWIDEIGRDRLAGGPVSAGKSDIRIKGLLIPVALAFDHAGDLWAIDSSTVLRFPAASLPGPGGAAIKESAAAKLNGVGALKEPVGLVADASGDIWVGDAGPKDGPSSLVEFAHGTTASTRRVTLPDSCGLNSVATDPAGGLWLGCYRSGAATVLHLTAAMLTRSTVGAADAAQAFTLPDLTAPRGVAAAPTGNVWVADAKAGAREFSPAGGMVARIDGVKSDAVAVDPTDGAVWLANDLGSDASAGASRGTSDGGGTVVEFPASAFKSGVAEADDAVASYRVAGLSALAVDAQGDLWLGQDQTDQTTGQVLELSKSALAESRHTLPTAEVTITGFTEPTAIAVTREGTVWVTDGAIGGHGGRLTEYTAATLSDVAASTEGADGLTNDLAVPNAAAVDAAGHVWTDASDGGGTLLERDPSHLSDQAPLAALAGPGEPAGLAVDVAAGAKTSLWVTNPAGLNLITLG
ncbi:MAG: hypothetical protein LBM66_06975 [Bifidobacteriaceae bacterium]|nr:hypothetical protein [Bifidobacteriaceae bacterium]